jgi:hypothetical protein
MASFQEAPPSRTPTMTFMPLSRALRPCPCPWDPYPIKARVSLAKYSWSLGRGQSERLGRNGARCEPRAGEYGKGSEWADSLVDGLGDTSEDHVLLSSGGLPAARSAGERGRARGAGRTTKAAEDLLAATAATLAEASMEKLRTGARVAALRALVRAVRCMLE